MTDVGLRVGFGSGRITPEVPVFLAGFAARDKPALSVRDELEAHAMVIEHDAARLVLVVCDLLAMSPDVARLVRKAVAQALDLSLEHVLTACTHTHTGPNVLRGGEKLGWPTPDGYERHLVDGCLEAALDAVAAAEPAELLCGRRALPPTVSMNRRALPYDPSFAVLEARRADGSSIGLLANVGVHPVSLGAHCLEVSPDWVGHFRSAVGSVSGGGVILLQGSLGDVNPVDPDDHVEHGDHHHAAQIGHGIAEAVLGLREDLAPVRGPFGGAVSRTIQAPVGTTPLTMLTGMTGDLDVELVEWHLGSLRIVSVPGEAFHALGASVEASREGEVLLAGLAPAWQGYLPEPWGDGYEETVSYGEQFVATVHAALRVDPFAVESLASDAAPVTP